MTKNNHKDIGVAIIRNDVGKILIDRRKPTGLMGGLWEFPGGKLETNETLKGCIRREIKEELGIEIEVEQQLISISHSYTHFDVTLHVYYCRHLQGQPQTIECDEIRWVTLAELDQFSFPEANTEIIAALRANIDQG